MKAMFAFIKSIIRLIEDYFLDIQFLERPLIGPGDDDAL